MTETSRVRRTTVFTIATATGEQRHLCGEIHPRSKLSNATVEAVRQAHEDGLGYRAIGRIYGLSRFYVRDLVTMRRRRLG